MLPLLARMTFGTRANVIPRNMRWHVFGIVIGFALILLAIQVGVTRSWIRFIFGLLLLSLGILAAWKIPHLDPHP
jgi:hypothetical protein